jgi:8-oxo-dGTP pyrophosphatase MutT (NUDIX family)
VTRLELLDAADPRLAPSADLDVAAGQLEAALIDDPVAVRHRERILEFIAAHPDALHRSCAEGHLTGSAAVVDAEGRRALVLLHRKLGRWLQPGGHADGDANLAAVALREATEETGIADLVVSSVAIDIDVHQVAPPGEAPHLHLDARYLVVAPPGAVEQGNHESLDLRWVNQAELDHLRPPVDESTRRLLHRAFVLAGGRSGG